MDQLLEDMWRDTLQPARVRAGQAREVVAQRSRMPLVRERLRTGMLWGSGAWVGICTAVGVSSEVFIDGGLGTLFAVVAGGMAVPAIGTGTWAWRSRRKHADADALARAERLGKQERAELPTDVRRSWVRLRRAQALVEELASRGLVDVTALGEQRAMVDDLRGLLVADRRAVELGATSTPALRRQVTDTADLLVALAAEAVEAGTEVVDASGAPATLRDAHERLVSLRAARAEVAMFDGAAAAEELIEEARTTGETIRRPRPSVNPTAAPDQTGEARPTEG